MFSPLQKSFYGIVVSTWVAIFFGTASGSHAQISKGHQILIDRGLQVQGLAIDDCYVTLSTYTNAHYTSINWINEIGPNDQPAHSSRQPWLGDAPGFPWSRWAKAETQMPPHVTPYGGDETPFMSQLIALNLADEWNLNDSTLRNRLVDWFIAVRANFPNTILYHNNWGSQVADGNLADFYTRAQPDMLCFDTYPWKSVWDGNQPDHIGSAITGSPTAWYGDLRRYREHARAARIPLGVYRQTFHAVQDYDNTVFRDPSKSELRLNTFAAMAFSATFFTDFVYNTGAASLFTKTFNGSGDTVISTNGLYDEMADVNFRARNFGKALVRLTPITTEGIPGYTTSVMFIRGRDGGDNLTPIPIGFFGDQDAGGGNATYTDWIYQRNDPYLTNNWVVTNMGTKNNGQPGDVIISWFKSLDEGFDGPDHTNEIYMMVVNGLTDTDPNSTAADCLQEIKLNFHSSLAAIEMLNPLTGVAELQLLPLTNGLRQLVLNLNGGDAAMFKFSDGAPFIGTQLTPITGLPVMTIHPADRVNVLGTHAAFIGRAVGSAPLGFQWQFNGTEIAEATTNNYTRSNVQVADAGNYSLIVSNSFGSMTSTIATLTVISSQPFFYEPFDYPNIGGPVSANTSVNWTFGGSGANDLNVTPGSLSYPGLQTSIGNSVTNGGAGLGVRRLLGTNVNSGTLYLSALFRINNLGYGTGGWNGNSSQVGALGAINNSSFPLAIMVKSNSPSGYIFGVQKAGAGTTPAMFDTTEYHTNETIFLAAKYDFNTSPNTVSLWVNPAPSTFGSNSAPMNFISATTGTDGLTIDRFNIRQNTAASVPAAMQWDELRVGSSWADVTSFQLSFAATLSNFVQLSDGKFQFSYTSGNGQNGSIYTSTNLIDWMSVGTATQIAPGLYQFTDESGSNDSHRFYQLRSP